MPQFTVAHGWKHTWQGKSDEVDVNFTVIGGTKSAKPKIRIVSDLFPNEEFDIGDSPLAASIAVEGYTLDVLGLSGRGGTTYELNEKDFERLDLIYTYKSGVYI